MNEKNVKNDELCNRREVIVKALNKMAKIFTFHDGKGFNEVISNGFPHVAKAASIDRIAIYRVMEKSGDLGQIYLWNGKNLPPVSELVIVPKIPPVLRWLEILKKGEYINGNVKEMAADEAEFLKNFGVKAVFFVPIFTHGKFWGVITLEDHKTYRYFDEKNLDLLSSAALLCAGTVVRAEMEEAVADAEELTRAIAEASSIPYILLDENFKPLDCNEAFMQIFECWDKQLILEKYWQLFVPELQPDGQNSIEAAREKKEALINTGKIKFPFTCQSLGGEVIPVENTVSRITHKDRTYYVSFKYDMRDAKKMMDSINKQRILLKDALEKATIASKAKGAFLSNMSHEMRTPLNAIIGMTSIGMNSADVKRKDYALKKIMDASTHLLGVINDVLDMSKIEANKFVLSPAEFDFNAMLQRVTNFINFRVEEKEQKFNVRIDPSIPKTLIADDLRIAQVITNLLTNAVKFTPEGGSIGLEAKLIGKVDSSTTIQVSVSDTGIGIKPEQQNRLFESFQQAENNTTRKFGGTGLGLSISKSIVEMMGGQIWMSSEPGKGSTFYFTMKAKQGDEKKSTRLAEHKNNDPADVSGFLEEHCILLAEDIEINREIVLELLKPTGVKVDCAENGAEAVRMFAEAPFKYGMIFMDVQMPEMDGFEATRAIRAMEAKLREKSSKPRKLVPIVAMTANVFREDEEKCIKAGMNSHIGKPLDVNLVIEKLRHYLVNSKKKADSEQISA